MEGWCLELSKVASKGEIKESVKEESGQYTE